MDWKVEHLPQLAGYTVEWAEEGDFILSRRNRLFRSDDLHPPYKSIGRVTAPFWKEAASAIRPFQRMLRFMVYNVVKLPDGSLFVTFDKTVGVIRNGQFTIAAGLVRPCRVLRSGCAIDDNGDIYFGEYLANDERSQIRIYRLRAGTTLLEIAHTFPAGSIKHIHGIYFDDLTGSLYCLTGDLGNECQILKSEDGFKTIEIVGSGDESWRAVSMLFDRDSFYYGTDAEFQTNRIYRVDRQTMERNVLGEVDGTVFYSKKIGDDLFFATTAENAPSQKENVAAIWNISPDGNCREIASFEKDSWPGGAFGFGTIHFPWYNGFNDRLYFSLAGLEGDDHTFCLRQEEKFA